MTLLPLAQAAGSTPWITLLVGLVVGIAVQAFASYLRGATDTKARLEQKAEEVVAEKFSALADGFSTRLGRVEEDVSDLQEGLDRLGAEAHQRELKIENQLNAIRVLLAEKTASREDMHDVRDKLQALELRIAAIARNN